MQDSMSHDRRQALQATRLAVGAYARDPSPEHQASVEEAVRRMRSSTDTACWSPAPATRDLERAPAK
jgi:hypothetical protein